MVTISTNTYVTGYSFINKKFAEKVCQVFETKLQFLIKPKQIQGFDDRAAKSIIHNIYLILTVDTHTKNLAPLLITKLRNYYIILDQP